MDGTDFAEPTAALAPGKLKHNFLWVQEAIYGHRVSGNQAACYLLLETLALCRHHPLGSIPFDGSKHEIFSWKPPLQRKLRYLLFQDRDLEKIARSEAIPAAERWGRWIELANAAFEGEENAFGYLADTFRRDFDDLLQAVRIARSLEVDVAASRAHFARFLAVTGPDMTLHDFAGSRGENYASKHNFFARGGELAYLMLNRAPNAEAIGDLVARRFLDPSDGMNRIVRRLSDPAEDREDGSDHRTVNAEIGYLPLPRHAAYDRMGEDWEALLSCSALPKEHLFDPLMRITGLNLLRYFAERAAQTRDVPVEPFLLDVTDGARKQLRTRCREALSRHREAADDTVREWMATQLDESADWCAAAQGGNAEGAAKALETLFRYTEKYDRYPPPEAQRKAAIEDAVKRSHNNISAYTLRMGRDIGMITARQSAGTWFAADDAMLRALVFSTVCGSEELSEFVARLHERYGIVIGPVEARQQYETLPLDGAHLEANLATLEARLGALGLTRRLSDDCAFVINPFGGIDAERG